MPPLPMVGKTAYPYDVLKKFALCPAFRNRLAVSAQESAAQTDGTDKAKSGNARIPVMRLNMFFSSVECLRTNFMPKQMTLSERRSIGFEPSHEVHGCRRIAGQRGTVTDSRALRRSSSCCTSSL